MRPIHLKLSLKNIEYFHTYIFYKTPPGFARLKTKDCRYQPHHTGFEPHNEREIFCLVTDNVVIIIVRFSWVISYFSKNNSLQLDGSSSNYV